MAGEPKTRGENMKIDDPKSEKATIENFSFLDKDGEYIGKVSRTVSKNYPNPKWTAFLGIFGIKSFENIEDAIECVKETAKHPENIQERYAIKKMQPDPKPEMQVFIDEGKSEIEATVAVVNLDTGQRSYGTAVQDKSKKSDVCAKQKAISKPHR